MSGNGTELRLLTIDEVATELRVPVATVRWLRQEGRFAPAIKIGRRLLWSQESLRAWVSTQSEAA
ncbi:helix-turn-helix domain-containing protein [Naumannella sp. ID2617S]|nr:helix-turn-helix domain-containing protein [Naumannella sp. ID2617S]